MENITKGEWIIVSGEIFQDFTTKGWHFYGESESGQNIFQTRAKDFYEAKANAQLICDAGNTMNKCGKMPSELLEQRDELFEMLKELVETENIVFPSLKEKAKELIKKLSE